MVIVVD